MTEEAASVDVNNSDNDDQKNKSDVDKEGFFRLAPFNPSSQQIQDKALELLKLTEKDVLFDLGCGDGRLLCHAVRHVNGLRCVGIEIDPIFVERAQQCIHNNLSNEARSRIEIRCQDALSVAATRNMNEEICESSNETATPDATPRFPTTATSPVVDDRNIHDNGTKSISDLTLMDDATALYLFVLPKGIQKLLPILEGLVERRTRDGRQPKFRILSYMFPIHRWDPALVDRTAKGRCPVYYYEWNGNASTCLR